MAIKVRRDPAIRETTEEGRHLPSSRISQAGNELFYKPILLHFSRAINDCRRLSGRHWPASSVSWDDASAPSWPRDDRMHSGAKVQPAAVDDASSKPCEIKKPSNFRRRIAVRRPSW